MFNKCLATLIQLFFLAAGVYHIANFNFFLVCAICLTILTIFTSTFSVETYDISDIFDIEEEECGEVVVTGFRGC